MLKYDEQMSLLMAFHRDFMKLFFKNFDQLVEDNNLMDYKLNHSHYKTLMILLFHGPMNMTHVSDRLLLKKGSFTTVASKLIEIGYILKEQCEEDKRSQYIRLTEEGTRFAKAFNEAHHSYMASQFDALDEEEFEQYFEMITKLRELNDKMIAKNK